MRRSLFFGAVAMAAAVLVAWRIVKVAGSSDAPFEPSSRLIEVAPLCPWRDPQGDLQRFFSGADRWQTETRVLSGKRLDLEKQFGRPPAADENAVHVHRVFRGLEFAGTILTRRAKGEHGAIEIVVAVNPDKTIRGVHFQRLREPPEIAEALIHSGAFEGRNLGSGWDADRDFPPVKAQARISFAAVAEAVRCLLVLLATSEQPEAFESTSRHP